MTKIAVEAALEGEMGAHLGYAKHETAGRDGGNSRNGARTKTLLTEVGPVQIAVPRDRDASFTLINVFEEILLPDTALVAVVSR